VREEVRAPSPASLGQRDGSPRSMLTSGGAESAGGLPGWPVASTKTPAKKAAVASKGKLAPLRAGNSAKSGGLGSSVSALLSRSRSTRKAIRSGGFLGGGRLNKTNKGKDADADAESGLAKGAAEEAPVPASPSAVALLDDGPLNRLRDCQNSPTSAADLDLWVPSCTCDTCTTKSQVKWVRRCESAHSALWLAQVCVELDEGEESAANAQASKGRRSSRRRSSWRESSKAAAGAASTFASTPLRQQQSALTLGLGEYLDEPGAAGGGKGRKAPGKRSLWRRLSSSVAGLREGANSRRGRLQRSLSMTVASSRSPSARMRSRSMSSSFSMGKRRESASYPPAM
jgi:hypothetical protein